jgi:hypothetical protein
MRRIGVLMPYAANDPQAQTRNAAFLQGLQQSGWNGKGMSQLSASPAMTASPHASGGRIMT